jgi:CBS domain containing-hemolysin-like protein
LAVLPKSLFRRFPFRALAALAGVLEVVSIILWPVLELGEWLGRFILPRRAGERARLFAAREELKQITTQSEREGSLTATERAMIHNVFDFRNVKVRDVMVPLAKVVAVQPDTPVTDALQLSVAAGVERLPVITREGKAFGLVNTLDILLDANQPRSLGDQMRRIVTANEDESASRIVQRLRAARLGLAAVLDRQSNLSGIVTIEDLIRRLVQSA